MVKLFGCAKQFYVLRLPTDIFLLCKLNYGYHTCNQARFNLKYLPNRTHFSCKI